MKYKINKRRAVRYLAALLTYAAISIGSSLYFSWTIALFVQLSLAAITSVALLYHLFEPVERIDHEEASTVHHSGDCCPDSSHS